MSEQEFDIIFRGDIVFGHQLADVKVRLQQLFKADAAKVDALFSGRPVPLKRGLDMASAQKYQQALLQAGAQVDILASGEAKFPSPPAVKPAPPSTVVRSTAPTPVAPVSTPAAPLTLAERLAQQEEQAKQESEQKAAEQAALERTQSAQGVSAETSAASWSLAPVGSYMADASAGAVQVPPVINTAAINLRPQDGNILDDSEQPPAAIATVVAPEFDVAVAGVDLISADEKMALPLLEIELEDWGLADLGENLINTLDKPTVSIPVIHIPDVGLAPAGADLGQLKPQVQAVTPDISGIRLAD